MHPRQSEVLLHCPLGCIVWAVRILSRAGSNQVQRALPQVAYETSAAEGMSRFKGVYLCPRGVQTRAHGTWEPYPLLDKAVVPPMKQLEKKLVKELEPKR